MSIEELNLTSKGGEDLAARLERARLEKLGSVITRPDGSEVLPSGVEIRPPRQKVTVGPTQAEALEAVSLPIDGPKPEYYSMPTAEPGGRRIGIANFPGHTRKRPPESYIRS